MLSQSQEPSVTRKAIIAFVVPIVTFGTALVAFQTLLAKFITSKDINTAISSLLSLIITFSVILAIKEIRKKS